MKFENLGSIQIDALREVSNIGSGNAATSLSNLLGEKVDIKVPKVNLARINEYIGSEADKLIVAVVVKVLGDLPGSTIYALDKETALRLIEKLTGEKNEDISEMGKSAIAEVGNIIAGAFINAISSLAGVKCIASVPAVSEDMLGAILVSSFVDNEQFDELFLDIQTVFKGEEGSGIGGNFIFIPRPHALNKLFKSIGIN